MDSAEELLEFAYKYPFSDEARKYVSELNAKFDASMLEVGKARLEQALTRQGIAYYAKGIADVKRKSIVSYLYARMLVSALNSKAAIGMYTRAEARRSGEALVSDTEQNVMRLGKELGIGLDYGDGFSMPFGEFLALSPKTPEYALVHQQLEKGIVYMQKYVAAKVVENAVMRHVSKGLPIPAKELPREVQALAKKIKVPMPKSSVKIDENKYLWIAKLLATPIADVRHRTVNLILAPYLVNVKNMSEDDAVKAIIEYIERCKQIDPNTRINEPYIRYQCRYAKAKGSKPLSHDKAVDLLSGVLEL